MTSLKIVCIGDPHFQVNNIPEVEMFMDKLRLLVVSEKPDIICVLGDLLHTHERVHTTAMNKAYDLVNMLRAFCPTYVLVGNHDMISERQFLTNHHWMNGMKEWDNVIIVDKVISLQMNDSKLVFCPYVSPGRFEEALGTLGDSEDHAVWKDADVIFAHQEFAGCRMGAIVSEIGDAWPESFPHVVSGHIHSRQVPQPNIYYTGSALQHAFGESGKNIIAVLTLGKDHDNLKSENEEMRNFPYNLREIDLGLPRKHTIYMSIDEVDKFQVPNGEAIGECCKTSARDKFRITLNGTVEEFKTLKRSKKYRDLINSGVKVVFRQAGNRQDEDESVFNNSEKGSFAQTQKKFMDTIEEKIRKKSSGVNTTTNGELAELYSRLVRSVVMHKNIGQEV